MEISVIIPTFKNTEVLIKNLRHNLPYLEGCQVIVVNDDPSESINEALQEFLAVTLIENSINKGFSGAVNSGAAQAAGTYLLLLNNDVKLLNDSYKTGLKQFESDTNLFAISFAQKEFDGSIVGKNELYWEQGFLQHRKAKNNDVGINGWAEGGSSLVDKSKFDELHGFDELYAPFYWEDVDLSYRAGRAGYSVLFNPKILVEHHHETTISAQFTKNKITSIAYRNQLMFNWKVLTSWSMIYHHKLHLFKRVIKSILKGDTIFLEGFLQASLRVPQVMMKRRTVARVSTDYEILKRFTHE